MLLREHLNQWYKLSVYYTAKTVADLPFQVQRFGITAKKNMPNRFNHFFIAPRQIVYPILYSGIVYFMSGQPFEMGRLWMYLLMGIMTSLVAQSIGLAIGAALNLQVKKSV